MTATLATERETIVHTEGDIQATLNRVLLLRLPVHVEIAPGEYTIHPPLLLPGNGCHVRFLPGSTIHWDWGNGEVVTTPPAAASDD